MKYFVYRLIKSRTLSLLKLSSVPNKIIFSLNFMFWTLLQWSHINPCDLFQDSFTCWHLHIQCWILSLSRLQKLHKTSCAMPISFNTILVAKILCNNLIWNHFSFTSCIFFVFLKQAFQSIPSPNFISHLLQQFGLFPFSINMS